jgi:hypothetical protein
MADIISGKVVQIIDKFRVVIDKGSADGVNMRNRFLVYRLGDEIFDPDTNESLGILELVCGEGKPEHIQERITTLYTSKQGTKRQKTVLKRGPISGFGNVEEAYNPETYDIPFNNVYVGCFVRQIR